jgi:hypothetical protein
MYQNERTSTDSNPLNGSASTDSGLCWLNNMGFFSRSPAHRFSGFACLLLPNHSARAGTVTCMKPTIFRGTFRADWHIK